MVHKCSMCSCGEQSSHAHGNIMQQHLLKPDLQLLSQVKDSPSELMTGRSVTMTCPHMASFVPVCPPGPLTRLIYTALPQRGSVRGMLQSPFFSLHGRCFYLTTQAFIRPISSLRTTSSSTNNLCSRQTRFNVNSSVSAVKDFFHGQRTLHLQYTAGLHLFSCTSAHSGVQPLKDSQHVKCSDHS